MGEASTKGGAQASAWKTSKEATYRRRQSIAAYEQSLWDKAAGPLVVNRNLIHPYLESYTDFLKPRRYYRQFKHWYQRARFGVSYADEWSLDYHIAAILMHSLPKYTSTGSYGQTVCNELLPEATTSTCTAEGQRAFDDMVATIVTGLDATYGEDPKVGYERYTPTDKAWELFGKYAQEFWW